MKEESSGCICGSGSLTRTIYACSGGSNVGQISNEAAKQLAIGGFGKFFCLAGVGGTVEKIIDTAHNSDERVVIDGCPMQCAKKIMENKGLKMDRYVVITELGIEKTPELVAKPDYVQRVIDAVKTVSH